MVKVCYFLLSTVHTSQKQIARTESIDHIIKFATYATAYMLHTNYHMVIGVLSVTALSPMQYNPNLAWIAWVARSQLQLHNLLQKALAFQWLQRLLHKSRSESTSRPAKVCLMTNFMFALYFECLQTHINHSLIVYTHLYTQSSHSSWVMPDPMQWESCANCNSS